MSFSSLDGASAAGSLGLQNLSCDSQVPGKARKALTQEPERGLPFQGRWLPGQADGTRQRQASEPISDSFSRRFTCLRLQQGQIWGN